MSTVLWHRHDSGGGVGAFDDAWGPFYFYCIITLFAVRSFSPLPEDKSFGVTANNKTPSW